MTYGEDRLLTLLRRVTEPPVEVVEQPHLGGFRADAAVFDPRRGIVLYEVKDYAFESNRGPKGIGRLGFELKPDPRGGWYPPGRDPVQQVLAYQDELLAECALLSGSAEGWRHVMKGVVVMTDASTPDAQAWARDILKSHGTGVVVLGGKDLHGVGREEIVPLPPRDEALMSRHAAALRTFLSPPTVSAEMAVPLELSKRQRKLATTRTATGRRRIRGAAGSGKSQVLAARASELSRQGKTVLVTCFNTTLSTYLRMLFLRHNVTRDGDPWGDPSKVVFMHFHRWAKWLIDLAGDREERAALDVNDEADNRLYGNLAARAIRNSKAHRPPFRFDAVLIDEGQDFYAEWWGALEAACGPGGEILLVADDTQDVYGRGTGWTDGPMVGTGFGSWMTLEGSYRLPTGMVPLLRSFAERYLAASGQTVYLPSGSAEQLSLGNCNLRWVSVQQGNALGPEVAEELQRLRTAGVHDGDIVLLVTDRAAGAQLAHYLRQVGYRLTDIFDDDDNKKKRAFRPLAGRVSLSTIHSFKGWEAKATVVIIGATARAQAKQNVAVYVAFTRTRSSLNGSHLTVINMSPDFDDWGRQAFPCVLDR